MSDNVVQVIIRAKDETRDEIDRLRAQFDKVGDSADKLDAKLDAMSKAASGKLNFTALFTGYLAVRQALGDIGHAAESVIRPLAELVARSAEQGSEMTRLSALTGLAVENLSRLQFASDQSGVSFEALTRGVGYLQNNLIRAVGGSKEMREAFSKVGIEAKDLETIKTDQLVVRIAAGMEKIKDPAMRAALATALLGISGKQLIPFFEQGPKAIAAFSDESDRLGHTMSTVAAVMLNQLQGAMKATQASFEGLGNTLTGILAPAITQMNVEIQRYLVRLNEWVIANQAVIRSVGDTGAALVEMAAGFVEATVKARLFGLSIADMVVNLARVFPPLNAAIDILDRFGAKAKEIADANRVKFGIFEIDQASLGNLKTAENELARLTALSSYADAALKSMDASGKESFKWSGIEFTRKDLERIGRTLDINIPSVKDNVRQYQVLNRTLEDTGKAAKKAADALSAMDLIGAYKKQDAAAAAWAKSFEDEVKKLQPKVSVEVEFDVKESILQAQLNKELSQTPLEPETPRPAAVSDFLSPGVKEWADAVRLSDKAVASLNETMLETNSIVTGITAGFLAFAEQGAIAFDMTAGIANSAFNGMMDLVNELGETFAKTLMKGGNILVNIGKTVANIVEQIITDLIAAIVKALIFKAIMSSIGGPLGFLFSGGGSVKMATGGTVAPSGRVESGSLPVVRLATGGSVSSPGTAPRTPVSPAAIFAPIIRLAMGGSVPAPGTSVTSIFNPIIRMAMGGSVPRTGGAAGVGPPLLRGASGFTVPGAIQVFDRVPALLAPGEVVLPTIDAKSPADLLGELATLSKTLTQALSGGGRSGQAQRVSNVTINTLDYSSFRQAIRSGAFRDEQDMAFELGR